MIPRKEFSQMNAVMAGAVAMTVHVDTALDALQRAKDHLESALEGRCTPEYLSRQLLLAQERVALAVDRLGYMVTEVRQLEEDSFPEG